MNKGIIKEIRKIVEKEANDDEDIKYHIKKVVKYALILAKKYQVDKELIEIAAWLHDVGRLPYTDKKDVNHHLTGAKKAEIILKKFNYPKEKIEIIKKAIICHRGSDGPKPKSIEEKIIANADAMSHFDVLPILYYWRAQKGDSFEKITDWVEKKYERNWKKKISLPGARKIVREKYLLNKKILKNLK